VFIWPPATTVMKPSKLATVTTAHQQCTALAPGRQTVWVSCPVQNLCLEWAVLAGIDRGVWGGLSEDAPNTQHPRHWREAAGDVNVAAAAPHRCGVRRRR
jgi:hypothetical protein